MEDTIKIARWRADDSARATEARGFLQFFRLFEVDFLRFPLLLDTRIHFNYNFIKMHKVRSFLNIFQRITTAI